MIIIKLSGGLGNQMFQYAFGKILSYENCLDLKLDIGAYINQDNQEFRNYSLDIFNFNVAFASQQEIDSVIGNKIKQTINKFSNKININILNNYYHESKFEIQSHLIKLNKKAYLDGYWQSPKYFERFSSIITKDFTFKNNIPLQFQEIKNEILTNNSVALHIRRGDYVNNPIHFYDSSEYLKAALNLLSSKFSNDLKVYVFSDDLPWCQSNLPSLFPKIEISFCSTLSSENDFKLMSFCKHFVIANSTFSWWAAYLGKFVDKTVIAPKKWFNVPYINTNDLFPNNWIVI